MSNIIKSRFIYLNDDNKKVIDSNERSEQFRLINLDQRFNQYSAWNESAVTKEADGQTFTEGIQVTVIDTVSLEEEDEMSKLQREQILKEAREEAARIIEAAQLDAQSKSEEIYEEARNLGYQDGMQKSMAEVQEKQNELDRLMDSQKQEYLKQVSDLEPKFAEVLALLVKSLTGVVIEDKHDVICYLIHKAILNADSSKFYIIRTSKEDYEPVMSKKVVLATMVKEGTSIDVIMDKDLERNQCLIETDTIIIDCSLDIQLNNLIQDIKFLSI